IALGPDAPPEFAALTPEVLAEPQPLRGRVVRRARGRSGRLIRAVVCILRGAAHVFCVYVVQ
ncbi:hypothetical protein BZM26_19950, partial [Paraburkholderia strydomiana]